MTKKELKNYFSHPRYDGIRQYVNQIMAERPDITDANDIDFAACTMDECASDGVKLSVDNALRLTKEKDQVSTNAEIKEHLEQIGLGSDEAILSLLQKSLDGIEQNRPKEPKMTDVARAVEMTRIGKELSDGNKDIVLMGIPADLSWSFAQLKLAFFTDKLTEEEEKRIYDLRLLSDRVSFRTEHGIGYGIFKIDLK